MSEDKEFDFTKARTAQNVDELVSQTKALVGSQLQSAELPEQPHADIPQELLRKAARRALNTSQER